MDTDIRTTNAKETTVKFTLQITRLHLVQHNATTDEVTTKIKVLRGNKPMHKRMCSKYASSFIYVHIYVCTVFA